MIDLEGCTDGSPPASRQCVIRSLRAREAELLDNSMEG